MTGRRAAGVALAAAAAAVTVLAGCEEIGDTTPPGWQSGAAWDVDSAAALPAPADPFAAALQDGYLRLARTELADYDWANGAVFIARARAAAAGEPPAPREPPQVAGMVEAQEPLVAYLHTPGAMLRAGRQIGEAQVSWDCWAGEAAEELGRQDLAKLEACRARFDELLPMIAEAARLPGDMVVVLPEEGEVGGIVVTQGGSSVTLDTSWAAAGTGGSLETLPVAEGEMREAFGAALGARPKPAVSYEVLFDFGSSRITDEEYQRIMQVAAEVRSRQAAEVLVTGHADAPGGTAGNLAVSRARAGAVRAAVLDELRRGEAPVFSVTARGEHELAVNTPRVERQNRRVVVTVR